LSTVVDAHFHFQVHHLDTAFDFVLGYEQSLKLHYVDVLWLPTLICIFLHQMASRLSTDEHYGLQILLLAFNRFTSFTWAIFRITDVNEYSHTFWVSLRCVTDKE